MRNSKGPLSLIGLKIDVYFWHILNSIKPSHLLCHWRPINYPCPTFQEKRGERFTTDLKLIRDMMRRNLDAVAQTLKWNVSITGRRSWLSLWFPLIWANKTTSELILTNQLGKLGSGSKHWVVFGKVLFAPKRVHGHPVNGQPVRHARFPSFQEREEG